MIRKAIGTAILFITALAANVFAAPVTYIFGANVNGTLDGSQVAGAFTLTATGDTSNVTFNGTNAYFLTPASVTVDVGGQSVSLNAANTYVFNNQTVSRIGFGVFGIPSCCDIIAEERAEYATYDLKSSIGPLGVVTNLSLSSFGGVPTSGGLLTIRSMESNTFRAIVNDAGGVPEPGSIALVASGTLALVLARRRRRA